jgi:hypothetical protein
MVQNWHDGCIDIGGLNGIHWSKVDKFPNRYVALSKQCSSSGGDTTEPEPEVGTLDYCAATKTLTLINRNVALHRRVLLLGTKHNFLADLVPIAFVVLLLPFTLELASGAPA